VEISLGITVDWNSKRGDMETTIKQWNVIYRGKETGGWVTRVRASFDDKKEAYRYMTANTCEHLDIIKRNQLLKDTQYKA